ncbi:magnesium/cobalt transporter CorA [Ascidiimonas sp. W6]|uniref:magnesium/cobalt transporter CorA n=1 Tax=Ascidiimonas meishanensis TaxID=3128903 RepID=UPI0030EBD785
MARKKVGIKSVLKKQLYSHRKIGKAPGTITYLGNREDGKYAIKVMNYDKNTFDTKLCVGIEEAFGLEAYNQVSWINVFGLSNELDIEQLGKHYQINSLVLEDTVNTNQRPKVDEYENYVFTVLKMLYLDENHELVVEHTAIVLKENTVLLFQEVEIDVFNGVRERIKNKYGRIRERGADYLFFALIDAIIDQYFVVLESIHTRIELLEEEVYNNPRSEVSEKIQRLKKEVLSVRKAVSPAKEIITRLIKTEHPLIKDDTRVFLRDAHDHSIQIFENIELYREMTMSLMEMYMTNMSHKMNEVMKVLTIIATIFIPLTFIAGIYGMNFKHMPELEHPYGYPILLIIMAVVFILMLFYFKRKKWL